MRRPTSKLGLSFLRVLRRSLGFLCLGIGILGAILPIIPGWPAFILAVVLLGRRDRTLRLLHLWGRRALRWMRRAPMPQLRLLGRWLSAQYLSMRRLIGPQLIAAERTFGL